MKFRARLGPEDGDDKAVRTLNREVSWTKEEITYEADQRHAEIINKILGMEGRKPISTRVKAANENDEEGDDEFLDKRDASTYRVVTARGNYLGQDRTDVRYAVKNLSGNMARPRIRDSRKLIRFGKYFLGAQRYIYRFDYQGPVHAVVVWTVTDYAGCRDTHKKTSGGVIQIGSHTIRRWSNTQKVIALSSGEAEYYGIAKGRREALGTKSLLEDLGIHMGIRVKEDSSAALGIASRIRLGKVRHIEVNQHWFRRR